MNSKRQTTRGEMTLEEKYERWKAFSAACYESQSRIASLLNKSSGKKKRVPELELPARNR